MSKEIRKIVYEQYKLDWMMKHGHSVKEIIDIFKNIYVDACINNDIDGASDGNEAFNLLINRFEENGFKGELWACYEEFLEYEYSNPIYVRELLDNDQRYEEYLKDFVSMIGSIRIYDTTNDLRLRTTIEYSEEKNMFLAYYANSEGLLLDSYDKIALQTLSDNNIGCMYFSVSEMIDAFFYNEDFEKSRIASIPAKCDFNHIYTKFYYKPEKED